MDLETLRAAWIRGERPELVLFWGHTPSKSGEVGKACLSQWFPSPFTVDGHTYATAEHWMMAGKARLFGDHDALADVLASHDPKQAKAIGRRVRGFDGAAWDAHKNALVAEGNGHKFRQNPEMRAYLLSTGDAVLVEASPYDRVWGIGLSAKKPEARDPLKWRGQNLLGFALMHARATLKNGG